jgi:cellobiose transport system substrate-binding protein
MGITAKVSLWTQDWNQAMANGRVASFVGASWMKQVLEEAAPDTSGKWRVTNAPGGAGNSGGSFLSVTTASQHPKEAFEVVKWLQNAENQLAGYNELQLFPSTIKTLEAADLNQPEAFFGGQNTTAIFSAVAKNVPLSYMGPYDDTASSALADQLPLMEQQNKNPDQAWNDAQQRIQRDLTR